MTDSNADFIRHHGALADRTLPQPGNHYQEWPRRRVIAAGELTEAEAAEIATTEVPAEYAYLDEELKDWRP